tara:strand:- start:381 stop:620 length:240 start_codon:yes stop_codon:yes gene_type:complete
MKVTVFSWKDERWSADKEALKHINNMIKREKPPKVRWVVSSIGDKIFLTIGWIAMSPFILSELIVQGFIWLKRKIKKGN